MFQHLGSLMLSSLAITCIRLFRIDKHFLARGLEKVFSGSMRCSDIMGDCIAKKDSWPIAGPLAIGPLAVTQPPKVLADGFQPICHRCNLLAHNAQASQVLPQVACWCKEKATVVLLAVILAYCALWRGGGSVSRGCAGVPNQTWSDIREGTKIYNADSTPVSSLSRISGPSCVNFSTNHQKQMEQWWSALTISRIVKAIGAKQRNWVKPVQWTLIQLGYNGLCVIYGLTCCLQVF